MTNALEFHEVRKAYKGFSLDIPSLTLKRGYVLGLIGRNGAGKSTTLKIAMNLIYPDSGKVAVLGKSQPQFELDIKRKVGYVDETPKFYEEMSVSWMAKLVSKYFPTWDDNLYKGYLHKFDLEPKKRIKDLSKGMRMKLALTLALSHRPELLILDEPASGIDPVLRRELMGEISEVVNDENRTVILSSHITQDIEQIADYVAILENGLLAEFADKESLLDRWKKVSWTSGTVPEGLFVSLESDGSRHLGVTDNCSAEFLSSLKQAGASNVKTTPVSLDEILLCVSKKESQTCLL